MEKQLKTKRPETEWISADSPVAYPAALAAMEKRAEDIRASGAADLVWLLEHPALYTAGTSADKKDLLDPRFPVFETGRGGQYTYHGPGQRVAYVMMDLQRRGVPDLRKYVFDLEEWIIQALRQLGVKGERRAGRVGIWVEQGDGSESKIAAIGVRVRKWVTFHGISVNINPDLGAYGGIVPCGLGSYGVTSLEDLGIHVSMQDVDAALNRSFRNVFGS